MYVSYMGMNIYLHIHKWVCMHVNNSNSSLLVVMNYICLLTKTDIKSGTESSIHDHSWEIHVSMHACTYVYMNNIVIIKICTGKSLRKINHDFLWSYSKDVYTKKKKIKHLAHLLGHFNEDSCIIFCITYIFIFYELLMHQKHNENFMGRIENVSGLTSQKHILQNSELQNLLFHFKRLYSEGRILW